MADSSASRLPRIPAEQRRAAAAQFERAHQVLTAGDFDYGLQLLLNCCQIDPASPIYRQALRQAQRSKYKNNQHGQSLAPLLSMRSRWRLYRALRREDYLASLRYAEEVLQRNPWDMPTHLHMATAFEGLGLLDLAIWTLEQVRPQHPQEWRINRPLAQLYERRGNFTQAIALWQLVRKARPNDLEAHHKAKDLAASATIARGRYEQAVQGDAPTPLLPSTPSAPADLAETTTEHPSVGTADGMPSLQDERVSREASSILAKIQANPSNVNGYLQLAGYYRKQDRFDRARTVLEQGLAATGQNFEIAQELLDLAIEPLRRDLAVTDEQLRKQPKKAELQQVRARLQKEINTRELDYYRQRAERYPTDTTARFEVGLRLLRGGQLDEAIHELQNIRNDPRHHGKVLFYLGFCFQSRKNWRLAQRNFEEALKHLGNDEPLLRKEAMYYLAVGNAEAGDLTRAIDFGCELANLDFSYKDIGERLDEWQAKAPR
jgi:tetratricopeptide (TPR) repeat protein